MNDCPRIPRRLAFRIWSSALAGRAAATEELTSEHSLRRTHHRSGLAGRAAASEHAAPRLDAAARLARHAETVRHWISEEAMCRGADLPADVVAHVCGWIFQHGDSTRWLRDRIPALVPIDGSDTPATIKAVLRAER